MTARPRLILIGGFLGAGKTTLMARAASQLVAQGRKVAVITNDQAAGLVDTEIALRVGALGVKEVAGGCFCCKFGDLVKALKDIFRQFTPDVILAEPVGSCTDLSATVLRPLRAYYSEMLDVAPYSVLADPARLREALGSGPTLLSDNVRYIYLKQLEEADLVVVNKSDLVSADEAAELRRLLGERFPQCAALSISALSDADAARWLAAVSSSPEAPGHIVDVDYDAYAEGEAELGWLNATAAVDADRPVDWHKFVRDFLTALRDRFAAANADIAHLKVFLAGPSCELSANVTGLSGEPALRGECKPSAGPLRFVVNARVSAAPEFVRDAVAEVLAAAAPDVRAKVLTMEFFRPGRPVPVHRFKAEGV